LRFHGVFISFCNDFLDKYSPIVSQKRLLGQWQNENEKRTLSRDAPDGGRQLQVSLDSAITDLDIFKEAVEACSLNVNPETETFLSDAVLSTAMGKEASAGVPRNLPKGGKRSKTDIFRPTRITCFSPPNTQPSCGLRFAAANISPISPFRAENVLILSLIGSKSKVARKGLPHEVQKHAHVRGSHMRMLDPVTCAC